MTQKVRKLIEGDRNENEIIGIPKNIFEHILVFDYEFSQPDGHNPKLVCLAIKDLVSGKEVSDWLLAVRSLSHSH